MEKLTEKQKKVFEFIKDFYSENAVMPTIREIAAKFRITIAPVQSYLRVLEKKGYLIKRNSLSRGLGLANAGHFTAVPVLGTVHAGTFLEPIENAENYVYINTDITRKQECFALKVRGDSMEPSGIVEGDTVVISKNVDFGNGDIVAALVDDEAAIKIYNKSRNKIVLSSANPAYPPIYPKNCKIIGKLIYLIREYKK